MMYLPREFANFDSNYLLYWRCCRLFDYKRYRRILQIIYGLFQFNNIPKAGETTYWT